MERLDNVFGNNEWIQCFPNASITHLPKTHSDHNSLLINLIPKKSHLFDKPFRLEPYWCKHPHFKAIVSSTSCNNSYNQALSTFKDTVVNWKNITFGDIFKNKSHILARLKGIQNSLSYYYSTFLQSLEHSLIQDYNIILRIEKDYWKLRSRIHWLNEGDANTEFFHIVETNRKRINKINFLKNDLGMWINNPEDIINHTKNYFEKAFTTSYTSSNWRHIKEDPRCFINLDLSSLDDPVTTSEITKACFSFKPYKAPGPDGLHPFSSKITGILLVILSLILPRSFQDWHYP